MTIGARGRKTLREVIAQNNAAERFYAAMAGKPLPPKPEPPRPPRPRAAPGADGMPLEKDILKACLGFLRLCPKVAWVGRFNSGTMEEQGRFIQMTSIRGFPDIAGMMKGGAFFAIEVKRHNGRVEPHQQQFLDQVNAGGGLAFVARSVDDVIERFK